jgi:hypothetical protein
MVRRDRTCCRLDEAYTKGYLKPADFAGPAGRLIAIVVRDERVTGNACAG